MKRSYASAAVHIDGSSDATAAAPGEEPVVSGARARTIHEPGQRAREAIRLPLLHGHPASAGSGRCPLAGLPE